MISLKIGAVYDLCVVNSFLVFVKLFVVKLFVVKLFVVNFVDVIDVVVDAVIFVVNDLVAVMVVVVMDVVVIVAGKNLVVIVVVVVVRVGVVLLARVCVVSYLQTDNSALSMMLSSLQPTATTSSSYLPLPLFEKFKIVYI